MAIMHELTMCPRSLNSYLLRFILVILAGSLWTCGNHDPFVVVTLNDVPPSTKFVDLTASVGMLNTRTTIPWTHSAISFFLPAGRMGGDGSLGDLVGKKLTVTVNAREDETCQLATSEGQTIVKDMIQQEMTVDLHPVLGCSLTIMMNGSPQDSVDGTKINYTITINNNGSSTVPAKFTTEVPVNTSFGSLSSEAGWDCGVPLIADVPGLAPLSCTNDSFLSMANAIFILTVKVNSAFAGDITNRATVIIPGTTNMVEINAPIIKAKNEARSWGCNSHPGQAR